MDAITKKIKQKTSGFINNHSILAGIILYE